jgi:two-component system, NarL family, nitrate/nitrite response regulator NarL
MDFLDPASPKAIRIFIVAAVRLYEQGLASMLGADPRFRVAGTAPDTGTALDMIAGLDEPPRVMLLDVGTPSGPAAVAALASRQPEVSVVALAVRNTEEDVLEWAEAGVAGLIGSEDSVAELAATIERVADGQTLVSPRIAATLLRRVATVRRDRARGPAHAVLTDREHEIVRLIDNGLSNKEIAMVLRISLPTVKNHVHHIIAKLNVSRRAEAAALLRHERATAHAGMNPTIHESDRQRFIRA